MPARNAPVRKQFLQCLRILKRVSFSDYQSTTGGQHRDLVAATFFKRAVRCECAARILLLVVIVVILIGIVAFAFPRTLTQLDMSQLDKDREATENEILKNIQNQVSPELKLSDAEARRNALAPLAEVAHLVEGARATKVPISVKQPIVIAIDLVEHIAKQAPSFTYTAESFTATVSGDVPIKIDGVQLIEVGKTIAAKKQLDGLLTSLKDLKTLDTYDSTKLNTAHEAVEWLIAEFREANNKVTEAEQSRQQALSSDRLLVEQQILNRRLMELVASKVANKRSAWDEEIPILSIRVGIVILLMYLSRVLLSTYRYLTALAAFYRARGHTLQILGEKISAEQLVAVASALTPSFMLDNVSSPDEVLANLRSGKGK